MDVDVDVDVSVILKIAPRLLHQVENDTQPGRQRVSRPPEAASPRSERVEVTAETPVHSKIKSCFDIVYSCERVSLREDGCWVGVKSAEGNAASTAVGGEIDRRTHTSSRVPLLVLGGTLLEL